MINMLQHRWAVLSRSRKLTVLFALSASVVMTASLLLRSRWPTAGVIGWGMGFGFTLLAFVYSWRPAHRFGGTGDARIEDRK